jgi:hypothetical protein
MFRLEFKIKNTRNIKKVKIRDILFNIYIKQIKQKNGRKIAGFEIFRF